MRLLRADEVAVILKIPKSRVYELARQKKIPSIRIGRLVRFPEEALRAWIDRGGSPLADDADEAPSATAANVPPTMSTPRRREA